jgi:CheY-like chemotaxis protein
MTTILIVEDEDEIRELLAEMLVDHGFVVSTARNGEEALRALGNGALPNVVLLDLMMPVMDGWKFRAEMLADPRLATIPVIIVSGAADVQDGSEALKAARVLTKPVKWPVLLESVQAHSSRDVAR